MKMYLLPLLMAFTGGLAYCSVGMAEEGLAVSFNEGAGSIKPLHGVNYSPIQYREEIKSFREAGIPFSRLHDTAGAFGGTHFVDIPNVFLVYDDVDRILKKV